MSEEEEKVLAQVTIQMPDGRIYMGQAEDVEIATTVPLEHRWGHAIEPKIGWKVVASGEGGITVCAKHMAEERSDHEWRCACGAIMPKQVRQCTECKRWRSFLY